MLKGYGEYKNTNYDWLPQIPVHWHSLRAKTMYRKMNRHVDENDDVVTCFRDGTVTLRKNRRITGFTESIKEIGYQGIKKGDLVIHVMDAFAGAIGVSDSNGKGTPVYTVCTAKGDYNNYYYAFVIREMAIKGFIQSLYRGIRERSSDFRYEVFGKQLLPIPPRPEQDQMVRYLNWKVSMIDKYINVKKKQIELLKERKQAIINQAVTKGLDPKVPLKDSGIEWLGEIPEHWETKELKYFSKSNLLSLSNNSNQNLEIKYIDISTTGFGCLRLEPESYLFKNAPLRARRIVHTGDTIISTVRTYLKSMLYIDDDLNNFIVSTGFSVLTPSTTIFPQLLYFVLSADYFLNAVNKYSIGVSYPSIADTRLLSLRISLPPSVTEQVGIFKAIKEKTYELDKCIEFLNGLIAKNQEYRTRLISDVVTGRVNVQNSRVPKFETGIEDINNITDSYEEE